MLYEPSSEPEQVNNSKIQPSYNPDRLPLGEHLPLDTPLSFIMDVSERCNFKCFYCYRAGDKKKNKWVTKLNNLMDWDTFEIAANQLAQFPGKIKSISMSGHGEPLLNPRIADMASKLRELQITERIEMHTNASLLAESTVESIGNSGFSKIIVSLQGLDTETYKRVCGAKIDWQSFYGNLKALYQKKDSSLKIHIKIANTALDAKNYHEDEKRFYSLFGEIADTVYIEHTVPLWKNNNIDVSDKQNKYGDEVINTDYCPLVFYKMHISPIGEIYPCTALPPPMSLGNIRATTLTDAWNSEKRREFLAQHLCKTRHRHEPCIDCFVALNTVTSQKDVIDPYKDEILLRLKGLPQNG